MKHLIPTLLIALSLIGLTACNSQRREKERLDAYAIKYPAEMNKLANQLYPCFTGKAKSDTVTKTRTDTITQVGTTTTVRVKDTVYVTKTMPGRSIITTRTLSIHDTVVDQRAAGVLNNDLRAKSDSLIIVKTQLTKSEKTANTWRIFGIAVIAAGLIFLGIKAYLLINGGLIKKIVDKV